MRRDDDSISDAFYRYQCSAFISFLASDISSYIERGDTGCVDEFLRVFEVNGLEPAVLAGVLRITQQYDDILSERRGFYDRVRSELRLSLSEQDTAQLLRGLL
jgi:hypothetical protein